MVPQSPCLTYRERRRPNRRGGDVYDALTTEACSDSTRQRRVDYFLPYLSGERTPHADPDARACFIGLTLAHQRPHMVRAIMEGVAYAMRDSLSIIREMGVPVRQIRASGGGSRSQVWRQIQADVFGQKVVTLNAEEGPAYGVALLAAVGSGEYQEYRRSLRRHDPCGQRDPCQSQGGRVL